MAPPDRAPASRRHRRRYRRRLRSRIILGFVLLGFGLTMLFAFATNWTRTRVENTLVEDVMNRNIDEYARRFYVDVRPEKFSAVGSEAEFREEGRHVGEVGGGGGGRVGRDRHDDVGRLRHDGFQIADLLFGLTGRNAHGRCDGEGGTGEAQRVFIAKFEWRFKQRSARCQKVGPDK